MFAVDRVLALRGTVSIVLTMVLALLALCAPIAMANQDESDTEEEHEIIDMTPDDRVGWSLRNVAAPLTAPFRGGLDFWYKERSIEIDTTPSGGYVDLFYVRRNFQKRFEQARTPVTVILPPRIKAGPRDSLTVRAFAEGYRQKRISIPVNSKQDEVLINLDPLPNILEALSHRYFAGRSTLAFLTKESPTFRVQESKTGFTLILSETAPGSASGVSNAFT